MIAAPTGPTVFSRLGDLGLLGRIGVEPVRARAPDDQEDQRGDAQRDLEQTGRGDGAGGVVLLLATGQEHGEDGDDAGAQHPPDDEAPGVAAPTAQQDGDVGDDARVVRSRRSERSRRRRARLSMAARVSPRWDVAMRGSEAGDVAPPAQRLLDQPGPASYAEQPGLLGLPGDDRGLDDVDVGDLAQPRARLAQARACRPPGWPRCGAPRTGPARPGACAARGRRGSRAGTGRAASCRPCAPSRGRREAGPRGASRAGRRACRHHESNRCSSQSSVSRASEPLLELGQPGSRSPAAPCSHQTDG